MKLDPSLLEIFEAILPRSVAVMNTLRCFLEQVAVLQEHFGGEHHLATARGTRYQQTQWGVKLKRFASFNDLEMVNDIETLGFYPNNLANGVLTAWMRFNRLKRVTLRLKQMGFLARLLRFANFFTWKFLAYHSFPLLILAAALPAAALLGRIVLAGALFRGFFANLLKSPNLSLYQCLFFILLFLSSFLESVGMAVALLRFLCVVTVDSNSPVLRTLFRVVLVLKSLRTVHQGSVELLKFSIHCK